MEAKKMTVGAGNIGLVERVVDALLFIAGTKRELSRFLLLPLALFLISRKYRRRVASVFDEIRCDRYDFL